MNREGPARIEDESKGLRRIAIGSAVGLAAGVVGLVLPVALFLITGYRLAPPGLAEAGLIQVTALLTLAGAILFAVSLTIYRMGFASFRPLDRRFWAASFLCMLGTIGVLLIVLPMALSFTTSDAMANCIQGSPTKALTCLRSAAPLAADATIAGVWLLWAGGLGVVVGISLASLRYRDPWLSAGAGAYAFLLLGLSAPILGFIFPIAGLVYPVLALPVLVLLAPALISHGSQHALGSGLPSGAAAP
ncbi:MAG: hypothetical protein L3K09_04665 [Thermoplasmata archaeon]|nr:hypothetical protein [Thermoplasmata archaeon]